VTRQ